ncbi:MAG: hypothetical protein OEW58_05555 [Gammaproteobacteria bacterium]|nr:hypothetical protein [Gammaproteobacteria bacterium]
MNFMPNWMKKTVFVAAALCVSSAASAEVFLHDDFNNGDPYIASSAAGVVVPYYWQRYSSSAFPSEQPTVTEANGRLNIELPAGVFGGGGIMLNRVLSGNTANPEAVGLWRYGGNYPLASGDTLRNTLDPRMHFLDNKTQVSMPSRYIRVKGIESSGNSYDYERGFKVELYANSQRRHLASYLRFEFVANRELRVLRFNNNGSSKLLMTSFLPNVPSAVEVMVDETEYRITAYYEFPVVPGQPASLRSGLTVFSGDHGINKSVWVADMLYGVETSNVDPRGMTYGISPFAYDHEISNISIDSITLGDRPDTAGNLGF